jgi:molecular chaperone Hsp33
MGAMFGSAAADPTGRTVVRERGASYLLAMTTTPAFLDASRPPVPDIVVARGITPFHLPGRPVRGRLVRLGALADALLTRHDNHPAVTKLSGESLALVAALATALKFQGSFSLQAKGDGAVPMLLADCTESGALRGYARAEPEKLAAAVGGDTAPNAAALLGAGYLAFTVDQGPDRERHQGIVSIEGEGLADMALHYFRTSEQLQCALRLACERTDAGWRASALILERVASEGGVDGRATAEDDDAWQTATTLAATVTDQELLNDELPAEHLIWQLFGTEGVAADRPRALAYGCRCSRSRLSDILEGFGPNDLDDMAVSGAIVMTCEFCNLDFRFERAEVRGRVGGEASRPGD